MATKSLALRAIEEHHMSKSAGTELCKDVAAAARVTSENQVAILTVILRRIQIYYCFG